MDSKQSYTAVEKKLRKKNQERKKIKEASEV